MSSAVAIEDRIDGEYYSPSYSDMDTALSRITTVDALGRLIFSVRKGIFDISPNRYRDKGVPLVRTFQIKSPLLSRNYSSISMLKIIQRISARLSSSRVISFSQRSVLALVT